MRGITGLFLIFILSILIGGTGGGYAEDYAEFSNAELRCVIGNNASWEDHRVGYNGIFRLTSIHQQKPLFVPAYAGLNLEHIFDGAVTTDDRKKFFEPRHSPMLFRKIDERTAELHQPATLYRKVESTTVFRLTDPCYIDVTFRCTPHEDLFEGGAFGLFWASYINEPLDKSTYFLRGGSSLEKPVWQQFCTQFHGHDSTVKFHSDPFTWKFSHAIPERLLFGEISQVTYAEPFFYGQFENMVFIVIFGQANGIRFAHSPSGGGGTKTGDDTCPAWDFQFVVPDYEAGKEYRMQYRAVYKSWFGRTDVLREVHRYMKEIK